ncbi:MAG: glycoside hydrolase family 55 protein [archaeon]|nr:glycoside hydrolase family 55 protein [archaeon]
MYKYNKLTPFKLCVLKSFPFIEADFDALTNYELMCIMKEHINNLTKNNNILVKNIDELNSWFDSLDVQEEVNNKLDEMASSGELTELITEYLNVKSLLCFDTVANLKEATNLISGSFVMTYGYHFIDDGGKALYKIRNILNTDVVDEATIVSLSDTNLIAELITTEVNVMNFGCYGDGIHLDDIYISKAINYAKSNNMKLTSPSGKIYLISETMEIDKLYVDFNNSTIITNDPIDMISIDSVGYYGCIENLTIDMNSVANVGINIINGRKKEIKNITINNLTKVGLKYSNGYEVNVHNCHINGNINSQDSIGLELNHGDSHFSDIILIDCNIAVKTGSYLNYLTRIHAWILNYQNLPNSKFVDIYGKCILFLNQCYSDTYKYTIYQEEITSGNDNPQIFIDQLSVYFNESIYSQNHYPSDPYILHLQNNNQTQNIRIIDSFIKGNPASGITTYFSNLTEYYGLLEGNIYSTLSIDNKSSLKNILNGLNVLANEVKKSSNVVNINILFSYDSSQISGTKNIGVLDYFYRPTSAINSNAIITNNQYNTNPESYELAYMYIDNNNVQVKLPSGTGTKYVHINITYII